MHSRVRERLVGRDGGYPLDMAMDSTPARDLVYDLISVQYHALKAGDVYDKYIRDAGDNREIAKFFKQAQKQDAARAVRAHELLRELTKDRGIG